MNESSYYSDIGKLTESLQGKALDVEDKHRAKRIEVGFLGKFFGTGDTARTNIVGLVLCLVVATGILTLLLPLMKGVAVNYDGWKTVFLPIITLTLGYLFGKARTDG